MGVSRPRPGSRTAGHAFNRLLFVGLGATLAAASAGYVAIQGNPFASAGRAPTNQAVAVNQGPLRVSANATGPVTNPTSVPLSFKSTGKLAELDVASGDRVVAGEVLARLDVADLQVQLEQSQATVSQQEASEAKVANGATPEQLAAADSQVQAAAVTLDGSRQTLQATQVSAEAAQAQQSADQGKNQQSLLTAQSQVTSAENALGRRGRHSPLIKPKTSRASTPPSPPRIRRSARCRPPRTH